MKRILIIGNSFSVDSHRYVHDIAKNLGAELDVHLLQRGGSTVKQHYLHRDEPWFDYRINDVEQMGAKSKVIAYGGKGPWTITEVVEAVPFDAIIMQNYWGGSDGILCYSGSDELTDCSPWYENMAQWLHEMQPNAELMINSVWSNEEDHNYTRPIILAAEEAGFLGSDGAVEFASLQIQRFNERASADIAKRLGIKPPRLIPVGKAIQTARGYVDKNGLDRYSTTFPNFSGTFEGDLSPIHPKDKAAGRVRLSRDGFHLSFAGRCLAGLLWVDYLLGLDVRNCTYIPTPEPLLCGVQRTVTTVDIISVNFEPISEYDAKTLREIAHRVAEENR